MNNNNNNSSFFFGDGGEKKKTDSKSFDELLRERLSGCVNEKLEEINNEILELYKMTEKEEKVSHEKFFSEIVGRLKGDIFNGLEMIERNLADPYITKDPVKLFAQITEDTPFYRSVLLECRRVVSDHASCGEFKLDFFQWIILCSAPLLSVTTPSAQTAIHRWCSILHQQLTEESNAALSNLSKDMVRQLDLPQFRGENSVTELDEYQEDHEFKCFEAGAVPLVFLIQSSHLARKAVNLKNPYTHQDTERIYQKYFNSNQSYAEYLANDADRAYRCRERRIVEFDLMKWGFECTLCTTLFQSFMTSTGTHEPAHISLIEKCFSCARDQQLTGGCENLIRNTRNFLIGFHTTFLWVQYIRAYVDKDDEAIQKFTERILEFYEAQESKKYCSLFEARVETLFYFDMIHSVFKPAREPWNPE